MAPQSNPTNSAISASTSAGTSCRGIGCICDGSSGSSGPPSQISTTSTRRPGRRGRCHTGTTAVVTRPTGGCRRPFWTRPCRMEPPRILCGYPDGTSTMVRHCRSSTSIWRARWHLSTSPGSVGLPVAVRDSVMPVKTRVRRWGRWRAPRTEPSTLGWVASWGRSIPQHWTPSSGCTTPTSTASGKSGERCRTVRTVRRPHG